MSSSPAARMLVAALLTSSAFGVAVFFGMRHALRHGSAPLFLVATALWTVVVVCIFARCMPRPEGFVGFSNPPPPPKLVLDARTLGRQNGLDAYFAGFTQADAEARGTTQKAARQDYLSAVVERPPAAIVALLRQDARQAERLMARTPGAERRLAKLLPWRVAILRRGTEQGYPHTHGGAVCLPLDHFGRPAAARVETLIHELVHVAQRLRPTEAAELVRVGWGYVALTSQPRPALARSNPDLDGVLYADWHTGLYNAHVYTSARPSSLADARLAAFSAADGKEVRTEAGQEGAASEHPLERMAYAVAARIARGKADRFVDAWLESAPLY